MAENSISTQSSSSNSSSKQITSSAQSSADTTVKQQSSDVKSNSKHINNVVHRTTSESLRINSSETSHLQTLSVSSTTTTTNNNNNNNNNNTNLINNNQNGVNRKPPPKTSSFQITSITFRTRGPDTGDDSADDLDESHTDDNSRITDFENETSSYSEDTSCSKEDIYCNNQLAPIIPTSPQYGLALVTPPDEVHLNNNHDDSQMKMKEVDNVSNNIETPVIKPSVDGEPTFRSERFKVVKIESTEPFKRGRWMCMDYLDHTALQKQMVKDGMINDIANHSRTNNNVATNDSGVVLIENHVNMVDPTIVAKVMSPDTANCDNHVANLPNNIIPSTISNVVAQTSTSTIAGSNQTQSMVNITNTPNVPIAIPQTMPQLNIQQGNNVTQVDSSTPLNNVSLSTQQQGSQVTSPASYQQQTQSSIPGNINLVQHPVVSQFQQQSQVQTPTSATVFSNQQQMINTNTNYGGQTIVSSSQQIPSQDFVSVVQQTPTSVAVFNSPSQQQMTNTSFASCGGTPPILSNSQPPQFIPTSQVHVPTSVQQTQQVYTNQNFTQGTPVQVLQSSQQQPMQVPTSSAGFNNSQNQQQMYTNQTFSQAAPVQVITQAPVVAAQTASPQQVFSNQQSQPPSVSVTQTAQQVVVAPQQQTVQNPVVLHTQPQMATGQNVSLPITPQQQQQQSQPQQQTVNAAAASQQTNTVQQQVGTPSQTINTNEVIIQQQQTQQQQQQASNTNNSLGIGNNPEQIVSPSVPVINSNVVESKTSVMNSVDTGNVTNDVTATATANDGQTMEDVESLERNESIQSRLYNRHRYQRLRAEEIQQNDIKINESDNKLNDIKRKDTNNNLKSCIDDKSTNTTIITKTVKFDVKKVSDDELLSSRNDDNKNHSVKVNSNNNTTNITTNVPVNENVNLSNTTSQNIPVVNSSNSNNTNTAPGSGGGDISATGISAVAIDNKIEQAMDLVKSHLMFAVREEVEVLKEKIAELMDRINHLERENTILRAHAPQEILSQLTPAVSAAKGQHQTNPTNGPFS